MRTLDLLAAAPPALLPIRIMAAIALVAVIAVFVHVFRHLKEIERKIAADDLVPSELGPRNNLVLMVCAIPTVVVLILLFLVFKG
jgi:heme/copper-type cytochrome/quinol oxidase subunit 2